MCHANVSKEFTVMMTFTVMISFKNCKGIHMVKKREIIEI